MFSRKFGRATKKTFADVGGGSNKGIWFTPTHVIKEVYHEPEAKKEVAAMKFMRALGIHETPDAQYVQHKDRHFVVSHRIHGKRLDRLTKWDTPPRYDQRTADLLAAERFMGATADRHRGNYMVHASGSVHPIDYGFTFNPEDSGESALSYPEIMPAGFKNTPISAKLIRRMGKLLPLVERLHDMHTPGEADKSSHRSHVMKMSQILSKAQPVVGDFHDMEWDTR